MNSRLTIIRVFNAMIAFDATGAIDRLMAKEKRLKDNIILRKAAACIIIKNHNTVVRYMTGSYCADERSESGGCGRFWKC